MGALIPDLGLVFERPRVGLYGGSFNPVHAGHVHVARSALRRLDLEAIVWLVSPHNPLKNIADLGDYQVRVQAARAFVVDPQFHVSDAEHQLSTQFTIDTVKALQGLYPKTAFTLIMGADSFATLHLWRDWQDLMVRIPIAVVARLGFDDAARDCPAAVFTGGRWQFLDEPHCVQSSTALRLSRGHEE